MSISNIDFNSVLGSTPKLIQHLLRINSQFIHPIYDCAVSAKEILERIPKTFPQFTLHNIGHSARVMDRMSELIKDLNLLSELEIAVLVLSSILHDVGMNVEDKEKIKICSHPKYEAKVKKYGEEVALTMLVRETHAERSAQFIGKNYKFSSIGFNNKTPFDYTQDICDICRSHQESIDKVKQLSSHKMYGEFHLNIAYCAILLRLADLLDLTSDRTPLILYELIDPKGISHEHWKKHMSITGIDFVDENDIKIIEIYGACDNSDIHTQLLDYLKYCNQELSICIKISQKFGEKYHLMLSHEVRNHIETKGFDVSDLTFTVDCMAITKLLSGEQLYRDKEHGLRELVQNSIDACRLRKSINSSLGYNEESFIIKIILDKNNNQVIVRDNGIGMNEEIIRDYFLTIGKSFSHSTIYEDVKTSHNSIGFFGIGFISCYMLSDTIKVRTRYHLDGYGYELELKKNSQYICKRKIEKVMVGTDIILEYQSFNRIFKDINVVRKYLEQTFYDIDIDICIQENSKTYKVCNNMLKQMVSNSINSKVINLNEYLKDIDATVVIPKIMLESNNWLRIEEFEEFKNELSHVASDIDASFIFLYKNNKLISVNDDSYEFVINNLHPQFMVTVRTRIYAIDNRCFWVNIILVDDIKEIFQNSLDIQDLHRVRSIVYGAFDETRYYEGTYVKKFKKLLSAEFKKSIIKFGSFMPEIYGIVSYKKENFLIDLLYERYREYAYLRGILIPNMNFRLCGFMLKKNIYIMYEKSTMRSKVLFNVKKYDIYPQIGRDYFLPQDNSEIQYAIGKALYLFIRDTTENSEFKGLIEAFISCFYSKDSPFIKK